MQFLITSQFSLNGYFDIFINIIILFSYFVNIYFFSLKYSKIKEYNLQDRLILKGKVSNVEDYYENSALYVMTSRFEGLPMTLLEAKNHKLPIVSFDCPTGPSEIIRNNVNGYLVKANDIKEMSNKVNSVLQDDKKLKEFSDKAELDIDKFNINSIIDKWTSLLVSI